MSKKLTLKQATEKRAGFTIVELLIVIVVVAILAAISVVAYNGIQNRANNTAVMNDIGNMGKKLSLFQAENGRFPNTASELNAGLSAISSGSYSIHPNALNYCYDHVANTVAVGGVSKSGQGFVYKDGTVTQVNGWPQMNAVTICRDRIGIPMPSGSYSSWRTPNLTSWANIYTTP